MKKQIFIGGTGRSGTTILYKTLASQKEIYAFQNEMRFIIDPNGLINLVDALTIRYSTYQAREALFRFEKLMRVHLSSPYSAPYIGIDFPAWFGKEYYWKLLDQFITDLVDSSYMGMDYPVEENSLLSFLYPWLRRGGKFTNKLRRIGRKILNQPTKVPIKPLWPEREMKIVKYFPDKKELLTLIAAFIDDLFVHAAHQHGKSGWCEKTPHNLLHIDFLWELFPQSYFIHIKRDPRGIAQSVARQFWGPPHLRDACLFLKGIYKRWFDLSKTLDFENHRYLEIKLEDLAGDPSGRLKDITDFCEIENVFINPPNISLDKVNYWKKSLSLKEKKLMHDILNKTIERMGYTI